MTQWTKNELRAWARADEFERLAHRAKALSEMFTHAGLPESQAVNNALLLPEYRRIDRT